MTSPSTPSPFVSSEIEKPHERATPEMASPRTPTVREGGLDHPATTALLEQHFAAMLRLTPDHAEIKSMRTAETALRRGTASAILEAIVAEARAQGIARLSLETGTGEPFAAAEALYLRHGFAPCEPFGEYQATDFNRYMTQMV